MLRAGIGLTLGANPARRYHRPMELSVLSFNLCGVEDGWFEGRRRVLVEGLLALRPDLICLQEVSSRGSPYPYDQVQDLADGAQMPYACFAPYGNPDEIRSRARGGIAMLSRWPFRMVETLQLPPGPQGTDARVAALGTLILPAGDVHAVCTHLSWQPDVGEARDAQVDHLLARVADLWLDQPGIRLVMAGDLNALENEPALRRLLGVMQDCYRAIHPDAPGHTWSHDNPLVWHPAPDRRLDYVLADLTAEVQDAELVFTDPRRPASDHYGVLARLRWPPA